MQHVGIVQYLVPFGNLHNEIPYLLFRHQSHFLDVIRK
jgi:hypothetical protein